MIVEDRKGVRPPRPWGQPRANRTVAAANTQHEQAALARAAERQKNAAEQKSREDALKERLAQARADQQRRFEAAMAKRAEARARVRELQARKAKLAEQDRQINAKGDMTDPQGEGRLRNRISAIDEKLNAAKADLDAARADHHEARQARNQAERRYYRVAGQNSDQAVADQHQKDLVKDRKNQEQAFVEAMQSRGYRIARDRDGKIIGMVNTLDPSANTLLDPRATGELQTGNYDFTKPEYANAGVYDPDQPNGIQFVDMTGQTGRWQVRDKKAPGGWRTITPEKALHTKGSKAEWRPYGYMDWVEDHGGGGSSSSGKDGQLGLMPLQKQGAILADDQGETWIRQPTLGAFGMPEGGQKIPGVWKTASQLKADQIALEKNDPEALKALQERLWKGGYYSGKIDKAPVTGHWDAGTDKAYTDFLNEATMIGAQTHKDLDAVLDSQIDYWNIQGGMGGGGGGGGGGGSGHSFSITDPASLRIYAQQAAKAVLGRLPTEAEANAAISQVQAAEQAEGVKTAGAIVNVDPSARMVEYFKGSNPTEFQAKNVADAVGMFSRMIGEGGLLGTGMASSSIDHGNTGGGR